MNSILLSKLSFLTHNACRRFEARSDLCVRVYETAGSNSRCKIEHGNLFGSTLVLPLGAVYIAQHIYRALFHFPCSATLPAGLASETIALWMVKVN